MQIAIRNGSKHYQKTEVLKDVDVDFLPGKIIAVLGVNGAGKTTLLELIYGLQALDKGELRYDGERYDLENLERRRKLCYLPSTPPIPNPDLLGLSVISSLVDTWERDEKSGVIDEILQRMERFGVTEMAGRSMKSLSRGEQYKFILTAYLSLGAEVCLFDEPFSSGIDAPGADSFRQECQQAANEGKTMIYTTQFPELVTGFADQICRIDGSQLSVEEVSR